MGDTTDEAGHECGARAAWLIVARSLLNAWITLEVSSSFI